MGPKRLVHINLKIKRKTFLNFKNSTKDIFQGEIIYAMLLISKCDCLIIVLILIMGYHFRCSIISIGILYVIL